MRGAAGAAFAGRGLRGRHGRGAVRAAVLKRAAKACPAISSMPGVLAALPLPPTMRVRGTQRIPRLRTWGRGFARRGTASFAGFPLLREGGLFLFWRPSEVLLTSSHSLPAGLKPEGSGASPVSKVR